MKSINSSKVYCKLLIFRILKPKYISINSSKVYCKWGSPRTSAVIPNVLIVAKCIVNQSFRGRPIPRTPVLIVAKCIVNVSPASVNVSHKNVLIVAKCIVNLFPVALFHRILVY